MAPDERDPQQVELEHEVYGLLEAGRPSDAVERMARALGSTLDSFVGTRRWKGAGISVRDVCQEAWSQAQKKFNAVSSQLSPPIMLGNLEADALAVAGRNQLAEAVALLKNAHSEDLEVLVRLRSSEADVTDICNEVWSHVGDVFTIIAKGPGCATALSDLLPFSVFTRLRTLVVFRFKVSPRAWLFTIARRRLIDMGQNHHWGADPEVLSQVAASVTGQEGRLAKKETDAAVQRAVKEWVMGRPKDDEKKRAKRAEDVELLWMRYREELSYSEIAEMLSENEAALRQRIRRIHAKLAARIDSIMD